MGPFRRSRRRKIEKITPNANDDGDTGGFEITTDTKVKLFRKFALYAVVLIAIHFSKKRKERMGAQDGALPAITKTFRTIANNGDGGMWEVHVMDNVLPLSLATKWRNDMALEWYKALNGAWEYSTACPTDSDGDRISSACCGQDRVRERNATSHGMRSRGLKSYSRWELGCPNNRGETTNAHPHPLLEEMERVMNSQEIQLRMKTVLNDVDVQEEAAYSPPTAYKVSALTATHFTTGDFMQSSSNTENRKSTTSLLAEEERGAGGKSLGVMLSLSALGHPDHKDEGKKSQKEEWLEEYGGSFRFRCSTNNNTETISEEIYPGFNKALVFRSVRSSPHRSSGSHTTTYKSSNVLLMEELDLLPVSHIAEERGFRYFGVSGWFNNVAASGTSGVVGGDSSEEKILSASQQAQQEIVQDENSEF
mmetsp:Transcript_39901/g.58626  ORF Transcript_39901/g.58626 Transcript_39901/m.58626 type:complete len:422 (-) Transcript_39901:99-1364(-)|eukprot:CAMPEP_0195529348 /NCGR_PEP_ID=MMETSP0794_2-20130614/31843_1 /TAXON_ID=515487 /ORGANISM="Stephanopyxis turris, Strain CCMP 815" /LENGTH=421 /DNA_ID=CAMNT_0040660639 /DNA_START=159 /DNA_END=1424 /DNA_ORIENTATION=+